MAYIGNQPANSFTSFAKQDFTTSATTSYSLDHPVTNANELALFINFVRQEPTTAYSASGTTLNLTSATASSDDMYCVFLGKALQTLNPADGSVGTSQLADGAVTSAKLASGTGGKILQVVSANDTTERSTSSTSYVTASNTLAVNITPSSTSSKIFITLTGNGYIETDNKYGKFTLYRDSTNIGVAAGLVNLYDISYTGSLAMSILDSPSSTSQITYQMYFLSTGGNVIINPNGAKSTITAFEIGA